MICYAEKCIAYREGECALFETPPGGKTPCPEYEEEGGSFGGFSDQQLRDELLRRAATQEETSPRGRLAAFLREVEKLPETKVSPGYDRCMAEGWYALAMSYINWPERRSKKWWDEWFVPRFGKALTYTPEERQAYRCMQAKGVFSIEDLRR